MHGLTDRQRMCLDFIRAHIDDRGYPPTLREIGQRMGIKSTNGVNDHLRSLERKGYIARDDVKSRGIRIVKDAGAPITLDEIDRVAQQVADSQRRQVVYFLQSLDSLEIKIGTTGRLADRVLSIKSNIGGDCLVLHVMPGGYELEAALHRKFDHLRAHGEWFRPDPVLVQFIREARDRAIVEEACAAEAQTDEGVA